MGTLDDIKLQINMFLNDMADKLEFMTDYDFLNLGWGPLDLTALYFGTVLLLLLVIIVLLIHRLRKQKKSHGEIPGETALKAEQTAEKAKQAEKAEKTGEQMPKPTVKPTVVQNEVAAKSKKNRKKQEYSDKFFVKWESDIPKSEELITCWATMNESQKQSVGRLSRENNWCMAYLKQVGTNDNSYKAIILLWEYQDGNKENLLKQMLRELADLRIEQSLAAVKLIKEINDERIVPLLLLALLQRDKYPPARVAEALSVFGAVAGRSLTALYRKVEGEDYKMLIMDALGQLGADCPMSVINEAIKSPSEAMRKKAAEVVGIAGPKNALMVLHPLLADSEGRVRAAAAAALGNIGGEEAYRLLRQLMQADPDWQVKSTCQSFIGSWEAAIMDKVTFDEVDEWIAEQQRIEAEKQA